MFCRGRIQVLAIIAFLTASGCKGEGPSGPGPGDPEALPESHPTATDSASSFTRPVWSENGAELGYVLPDNRTAVARSGGTGSRRELFAVTAPAQIVGLELSKDASEWFTISASGVPGALGTTIRRHTASSVEVVTDRGGTSWATGPRGRAVLPASNGDFAFIVRPDSLYFRRKAGGGAQFLGVGCVGIAAISPIGDGVICYRPTGSYSALRFTTSAASSATEISGSESGALPLDFLWNDQGIYMAFGIPGHVVFERHSDPQSKFPTPRPTGLESSGWNVSLALDGRSFSFVNGYCTPSRGLYFGCETYQFLIYHADAVTRATKRLAVHSTFGGDAVVSISPDGRRIAYTLGRLLYVLTAN